jgi:serine/threonine protein kinase
LKLIKLLGEGNFGKVFLARKISKDGKSSNEEKLAVKIVPHRHVRKVEKEVFILAKGHPFLVQLVTSFHTEVTYRSKLSMTMH